MRVLGTLGVLDVLGVVGHCAASDGVSVAGCARPVAGAERRPVMDVHSVMGVYAVMRKWHLGVGISDAMSPTRSLFM